MSHTQIEQGDGEDEAHHKAHLDPLRLKRGDVLGRFSLALLRILKVTIFATGYSGTVSCSLDCVDYRRNGFFPSVVFQLHAVLQQIHGNRRYPRYP